MATRSSPPARRPTNVTLDPRAVADARELGINVSQACERGLVSEIKVVREARWIEENWEAIQSTNAWVERHGLPLAKYRVF
jgi:antitoxin CcdA